MSYKFQKTRAGLVRGFATACSLAVLLSILPSLISTANAQGTRNAYLEEFTGSWCGFCVRGAYAIQKLEDRFPGQVVALGIHQGDPMENLQGDTLIRAIGFPSGEALQGFPDGWTARSTVAGTSWNVDPSQWSDSVGYEFGYPGATLSTPGLVDAIITQPATAQVTVDQVSYNASTQMITARVTAKFNSAVSGDLRLNLMLTEDSVTGPDGTTWDQHNYYSSQDASVGGQYPNNPLYSKPYDYKGYVYMHVFREAVGGVYGVAGVIPSSPTVGTAYSTTFTFPLPSTVLNPNHVHLAGLVGEYSATDANGNEVFNATEVPLSTTTIPFLPNNILVTADNGAYGMAHAGGDTTMPISLENDGTAAVSVKLSLAASNPLPTGWSATFSPNPVPVPAGGLVHVNLTLTAPQQAGFIGANIVVQPQSDGVFIPTGYDTIWALSDNTLYPVFYDAVDGATGAAIPTVAGMPDTMRLHSAIIPLSNAVLQNYPPENYPLSVYDNIAILDNGGYYSNPSILPNIAAALAAGNKVFFSSNEAMYFAEDPNASSAAYTETSDVQNFYAMMGLNFTATKYRYNTQTGAPIAYSLKGLSTPIGNGITATNSGGTYIFNSVYSIDSNSVADFYSDANTKNIIGSHYEDATTHGRIVYLGFDLVNTVPQAKADTIFNRSIQWLMFGSSAAVNPTPGIVSTGITASPNPFHGLTQVSYTAAPGEKDVTLAAYDLLGRQVVNLHAEGSGNTYTAAFDGSKLPEGTYIIMAHSSRGTQQIKVVNQE